MGNSEHTISLFEDVAETISAKYLAEIKMMAGIKGSRPDFEEIMPKLSAMEKELTQKALAILEAYKKEQPEASENVTDNLSRIIKSTIEGFIKQL